MWGLSSSQDRCRFSVKKAENWHWRLEKVESMQLIVVKVGMVSFLLADNVCMLVMLVRLQVDMGNYWQV